MFKKVMSLVAMLVLVSNLFAVEGAWMRTDADHVSGFYMWFGATGTCPFSDRALLHDIIYYPSSNSVQADIGPSFNFGNLAAVPMIGLMYDMASGETTDLIPQLYFYYKKSNIYIEAWNMLYVGTAAATSEKLVFDGRYFMKFSGIVDWMSFGPQLEFTYNADDDLDEAITAMPVGGRLSFPYGEGNSLEMFIGVDTKNDNRPTSRISFVRVF